MIAATIANVNRDPKKATRAFVWQDFFAPRIPEPAQREMSVEESVSVVAGLNAMFGGVDLRPERPTSEA